MYRFRADALICEQVMGTGYATTKKEAKKKAAENTIAKLCPHFLVNMSFVTSE